MNQSFPWLHFEIFFYFLARQMREGDSCCISNICFARTFKLSMVTSRKKVIELRSSALGETFHASKSYICVLTTWDSHMCLSRFSQFVFPACKPVCSSSSSPPCVSPRGVRLCVYPLYHSKEQKYTPLRKT